MSLFLLCRLLNRTRGRKDDLSGEKVSLLFFFFDLKKKKTNDENAYTNRQLKTLPKFYWSSHWIFPGFKQFATSRMLLNAGHRGRLYRSFIPNSTRYPCANCTSVFGQKRSLLTHLRYECGQPPRFKCPYCDLISKKTSNIQKHIRRKHEGNAVYVQDIYLLPNLTVWTTHSSSYFIYSTPSFFFFFFFFLSSIFRSWTKFFFFSFSSLSFLLHALQCQFVFIRTLLLSCDFSPTSDWGFILSFNPLRSNDDSRAPLGSITPEVTLRHHSDLFMFDFF